MESLHKLSRIGNWKTTLLATPITYPQTPYAAITVPAPSTKPINEQLK